MGDLNSDVAGPNVWSRMFSFFSDEENVEKAGTITKGAINIASKAVDTARQMSTHFEKIAGGLGFLKEKTLQAFSAGVKTAQPAPQGLLPTLQEAIHDVPAVACGVAIGVATTVLTAAVIYGVHTLRANKNAKVEQQQKSEQSQI